MRTGENIYNKSDVNLYLLIYYFNWMIIIERLNIMIARIAEINSAQTGSLK